MTWICYFLNQTRDLQLMKQRVREKSALQGLPQSRLPEFTDDEKKLINGKNYFSHLGLINIICQRTIFI